MCPVFGRMFHHPGDRAQGVHGRRRNEMVVLGGHQQRRHRDARQTRGQVAGHGGLSPGPVGAGGSMAAKPRQGVLDRPRPVTGQVVARGQQPPVQGKHPMTIGRTRQMEPRRTIVPKARAQRVHRQAARRHHGLEAGNTGRGRRQRDGPQPRHVSRRAIKHGQHRCQCGPLMQHGKGAAVPQATPEQHGTRTSVGFIANRLRDRSLQS